MDSFETLAEVAIGIAGFGSIAIVLGRDLAGWETADFFRTASLFMTSFGALFFALLPVGLAMTSLAEEELWRLSSGSLVGFLVLLIVMVGRWRRRHLDPELWFGPALFGVVASTTLLNVAAQLSNALGTPFAPNRACYFFGIVWLLAFACLFFARIVFVRPRVSDTPSPGGDPLDSD